MPHNHPPRCCCELPDGRITRTPIRCPSCIEHGDLATGGACPTCHQLPDRPHTEYCPEAHARGQGTVRP